jgi:hypothetical protein
MTLEEKVDLILEYIAKKENYECSKENYEHYYSEKDWTPECANSFTKRLNEIVLELYDSAFQEINAVVDKIDNLISSKNII